MTQTGSMPTLTTEELEAIYAISRTVSETVDIDEALGKIVAIARPVFIFDNAVLYLDDKSGEGLEPAFARAIGRGRSSEADISWGETAGRQAYESGEMFIFEPELDPEQDRLEQPYYLALPLRVGGEPIGSVAFVRFGGPTYTQEQIHLAEYIAAHITQVLEHQRLVARIANLEAERRLAQLQSDFIATISHELKTPLGFIKGYSTTLLRQDTEWASEDRKEFLTIINEESDHLANLVDNLLDSSRLQSGILEIDMQTVELPALVEEICERLRAHYPELEISQHSEAENIKATVDPKRFSQIIDNLVSNAAKYAPGSQVQIRVSEDEKAVYIEVADEGPGISPDYAMQIFKRFYRMPEHRGSVRGTGLGLYICQQIAHAHGGEIRLQNTGAKGASFIIELPKERVSKLVLEETET